MGKPGCKCRYDRCLGGCREVYARQSLAPNGSRLNIIDLRSWFLGGRFTDREAVGALRPQMNFLMLLSRWFGDSDPRIGTAWEKGERLAKLISHRRTLLVLDGLEPLQNPPGPQEGRLRDPSLQAFLRELAAFNSGLCVITTRLPVADLADHEHSSAPRRDLEQLSSDAGAKLLQALGVKGDQAELRSASDEFSGHCLALTLLGSYLTDAYVGDIRCRKEVSEHLSHDVRQGVHARKVMESYQAWLGEGPELSVLRMLGLFDRPANEKALEVLLKPPAIPGLTESLTDLSPSEWQMILARLRRARLLTGEDPHNPGHLDAHPLVREYFGEQLPDRQADAWRECNRRLYHYYRTLAPQLPNSFREMEPLFLAVICGCNAGLFREALHELYIPRIQRGNAYFVANVLGARGALLTALVHFFEDGRWSSPVKKGVEAQRLTAEDQLFVLMQAGLYLSSTRGFSTPESTKLLRARGAFVPSAQPPSAPVFRADGTVALFLHRRQAECSAPGRTTSPFVGNGAKQLRGNDRSLSGFGIDALLFGRVRDGATIRDAWCSDMAVGGRTV